MGAPAKMAQKYFGRFTMLALMRSAVVRPFRLLASRSAPQLSRKAAFATVSCAQNGACLSGNGHIRGMSSVAKSPAASSVSRAEASRRVKVWDKILAERRAHGKPCIGAPSSCAVVVNGATMTVDADWTPASLVTGDEPVVIVAAKVNGVVKDLRHPIMDPNSSAPAEPVTVELIPANTPEGKEVLWHSAAHILGAALQEHFGDGTMLTDGPPLSEDAGGGGFFYELYLSNGRRLTDADFEALTRIAKKVAKGKSRFDKLQVSKAEAAAVFEDNPFKLALLDKIPASDPITLYRCGDFVDLCRGPHVPHTGIIKGFVVTKSSGSHLDARLGAHGRGVDVIDDGKVLLQRAYGIAFTSQEDMQAWEAAMELAKARDHRVIGKAQGLFMFHDMSPGSAFMLPHGTRIYNTLIETMRSEYRKRGYQEVMTPLMYRQQLWKTSGHWENYKENMFVITGGGCDHNHSVDGAGEPLDEFGLKPMNCPGHCLIFASRKISYRELPLRIADFSSLHRNEATGALGGLTRLRRFQQDDAHIFCAHDQIPTEIASCLEFIEHIYSLFHFKFRYMLSTRPEKYMGELSVWNSAETALQQALERTGRKFEIQAGEGAFYGPKIDVVVKDAVGREHQCATLQLDFQLPIKFGLEYADDSGSFSRPVMIHRAILGSVERMMAILIEHTGGRWPFWLSPRQITVCPVSEAHEEYGKQVFQQLQQAGYYVDMDASARTVPKRVRAAQVAQYNLILVVGDKEKGDNTVSVRCRDVATQEAFVHAAGLQGLHASVDSSTVVTLPQLLTACAAMRDNKL